MKPTPLPEQFLERLRKIVSPREFEQVLHGFSVRRPTTLRVNTLKTTAIALETALAAENIELTRIPWWKNAFVVVDTPLRTLTELTLYKEGYFYVQSLSSMVPALVLDPKPENRVLDITAAPGSKTTQMAALMENSGEIAANDISPIRLLKLSANLKIQGVTNTKVIKSAGQLIWKNYPEYFDKVLVDVPCSMEGRMNVQDPKTYEHWSMAKIRDLEQEQRFLLRSAVSATKPGGVIVYSTCTLAPEENEGIVDWILKKEKGAVEVVEIEVGMLPLSASLKSWNTKIFDPRVAKTARILPSEIMEGFYIAKLRKIRSSIPASMKS